MTNGGLKIYDLEVDELRPVTTPEERQAWEDRMREALKDAGFTAPEGAQLFDTCCGGNPDDCGIV